MGNGVNDSTSAPSIPPTASAAGGASVEDLLPLVVSEAKKDPVFRNFSLSLDAANGIAREEFGASNAPPTLGGRLIFDLYAHPVTLAVAVGYDQYNNLSPEGLVSSTNRRFYTDFGLVQRQSLFLKELVQTFSQAQLRLAVNVPAKGYGNIHPAASFVVEDGFQMANAGGIGVGLSLSQEGSIFPFKDLAPYRITTSLRIFWPSYESRTQRRLEDLEHEKENCDTERNNVVKAYPNIKKDRDTALAVFDAQKKAYEKAIVLIQDAKDITIVNGEISVLAAQKQKEESDPANNKDGIKEYYGEITSRVNKVLEKNSGATGEVLRGLLVGDPKLPESNPASKGSFQRRILGIISQKEEKLKEDLLAVSSRCSEMVIVKNGQGKDEEVSVIDREINQLKDYHETPDMWGNLSFGLARGWIGFQVDQLVQELALEPGLQTKRTLLKVFNGASNQFPATYDYMKAICGFPKNLVLGIDIANIVGGLALMIGGGLSKNPSMLPYYNLGSSFTEAGLGTLHCATDKKKEGWYPIFIPMAASAAHLIPMSTLMGVGNNTHNPWLVELGAGMIPSTMAGFVLPIPDLVKGFKGLMKLGQ